MGGGEVGEAPELTKVGGEKKGKRDGSGDCNECGKIVEI